jgi:hypothetical protein
MTDLFRYIEHDFAVPAKTDAIDVANPSAFQTALDQAARGGPGNQPAGPGATGEPSPAEQVRALARQYLADNFASPTDDPARLGGPLTGFATALRALSPVNPTTLRRVVQDAFGRTAQQVVATAEFRADRELLQNAVLAVKLATGFDRVDTARVARQLRAAAVLEYLATADPATVTAASIADLLARPLRIPPILLAVTTPPPPGPVEPPAGSGELERVRALRRERGHLQASYDALLAVPPNRLEITAAPLDHPPHIAAAGPAGEPGPDSAGTDIATGPPVVRLGRAAQAAFSADQLSALSALSVDLAQTPVGTAVAAVRRRLTELNAELLPLEVQSAARVFRVGAHMFAEATPVVPLAAEATPVVTLAADVPLPVPDFSHAVTRPVGVGNLQVVRQELVGYRAGDISHIENVLEGEVLRRSTHREELTEVTVTEETVSTQAQERDQQSTDRNELTTETQQEAGRQSSTAGGGMSSSDYGKLVENNKTNFAQTVTARAVESVTQVVRKQRVQRERKTFVEDAVHELDNQKGTRKVRGIYQWVDKRYSLRVLNYGKRLMYDVVVPEPAAFLVQALKDSVQPESFQLSKPLDPNLTPGQLNAGNYAYYATVYGVTGSVAPPPTEYTQSVTKAEPIRVDAHFTSYGVEINGPHLGAFTLQVPPGYRAISGYVQRVNVEYLGEAPDRKFEFFIGESNFVRFGGDGIGTLNSSFLMAGETGDIPVTFRSFAKIVWFSYAVALVCQRTDNAYEQWQLKTHATIVSGYQRQLAEYEEKLSRYVAAARTQLAMAGNYAHDPSVEREELKRAFVFLLLGEHPKTWLPTPVPAPVFPWATLPDPVEVREWGAVVAFFERAFEWENLMFTFYPYYWGRPQRWEEMLLTQDADPQFEAFLKAGAARVVVPVRPGFEAALAHYQETGDVWMGEEIPDMFGDHYLSIIAEIKAANLAPGEEVCVDQWEVTLPTTLVLLKDDATLPTWTATPCAPPHQ